MSTAQQLREAVATIRRKPMPLAALIPLMQEAADELETAPVAAAAAAAAQPELTDAQIIAAAKAYEESQPPSAKYRLSLMLLNSGVGGDVTVGDFQQALCGVVRAALKGTA